MREHINGFKNLTTYTATGHPHGMVLHCLCRYQAHMSSYFLKLHICALFDCYPGNRGPLSNVSSVDCLILYACRLPRCGSVIASREPLLIQRRTVVSSTRR